MTDEEMAEQYADTVKCEWENDTYWVDCRDKVTDSFLAGLKAGKDMNVATKWHKVVDGDLPPENTEVLNDYGDKIEYIGYGKWQMYSDYYEEYVEVKSPTTWCEIPRYKEE